MTAHDSSEGTKKPDAANRRDTRSYRSGLSDYFWAAFGTIFLISKVLPLFSYHFFTSA